MEVVFRRRRIRGPFAHHDWIQAGEWHYELAGMSDGRKVGGEKNEILGAQLGQHEAEHCEGDTGRGNLRGSSGEWPCSLGTTFKSHEEIAQFNIVWLEKHPCYHVSSSDCQTYARDLANFLGVDISKLPVRDGNANGSEASADFSNFSGEDIEIFIYNETDKLQWVSQSRVALSHGCRTTLWHRSCDTFVIHIKKGKDYITSGHGFEVVNGCRYKVQGDEVIDVGCAVDPSTS